MNLKTYLNLRLNTLTGAHATAQRIGEFYKVKIYNKYGAIFSQYTLSHTEMSAYLSGAQKINLLKKNEFNVPLN